MRTLKLVVAYDGTTYHGWQVQPGVPTVQGTLEQALIRILDQPVTLHGSGRTDRGVHADGQVAHLLTAHPIAADTLASGLNALLPPDIRVLGLEDVPAGFHARLSAVSKTYEYHIWRDRVVDPQRHRFVYSCHRPIDTDALDKATELITGTHDFRSFCTRSAGLDDYVRSVYAAGWDRGPREWVFSIRADGFLRYMVRTIVGTLLEVGFGRTRWAEIERIFLAQDRRAGGPSVPPSGLHLVRVDYPNPIGAGVENKGS